MKFSRWFIGLGALIMAGLALYVLTAGRPQPSAIERAGEAMDEIDDESREAMRDLLREAQSE